MKLFADDANQEISSKCPLSLQQLVNDDELLKVDMWMRRNQLTINYSKTNFMILSKKKVDHNFDVKIGKYKIQ